MNCTCPDVDSPFGIHRGHDPRCSIHGAAAPAYRPNAGPGPACPYHGPGSPAGGARCPNCKPMPAAPPINSAWINPKSEFGLMYVDKVVDGSAPGAKMVLLRYSPGVKGFSVQSLAEWPGDLVPADPITKGGPSGSDCGATTLEQARAPLRPSLEQIIRQRMKEQNEIWRSFKESAETEKDGIKAARLHILAAEAAQYYRAFHEILVEAGLEMGEADLIALAEAPPVGSCWTKDGGATIWVVSMIWDARFVILNGGPGCDETIRLTAWPGPWKPAR
jgi:hypothetical protein